ncbi:MAG: MBL fold metallo-hydrolase [Candidatus Stygibacter australis]|nr:MBL fold metallo-hydrolase [Candidatus Stygibacter australis]
MTNIYLLQSEFSFYVLLDTSISTGRDKFIRQLSRNGISPSQIKIIIITHAHPDHIGCLSAIKELTGAKVIAHKEAAAYIESGYSPLPVFSSSILNNIAKKVQSRYPESSKVEPTKVDIVIDRDYDLKEWGIQGKVILTPGHTMGSVSVILENGESFVGDTLFNISPFTIMPPIVEDRSKLENSWQRLIKRDSEYYFPGHGNRIPRKRFLRALKRASK